MSVPERASSALLQRSATAGASCTHGSARRPRSASPATAARSGEALSTAAASASAIRLEFAGKVAAFRHNLGTLWRLAGWYDTNVCSPHWMGRSTRCGSGAARRAAASCAALCAQEARIKQRVTEIVREADDDGDWQAAGCSSSAQWLAQLASSDYRSAARITRTSSALRSLPALDHALSTGALTLDQVAAAAQYATPASDAELARLAVGKPPSEIALAARTLAPPTVTDDQELYERRALSMTWTRGRRELAFNGRLPLEQGAAFEQAIWSIAKTQRAADKQAGTTLEWQQSAADALVTLARQRRRRRRCDAQPHHPDRAPQRRRAAAARRRRATQPRDRRATRLRRTPPHDQAQRPRPPALPRRTLRLLRAAARTPQALRALPVPRLHRHPRTRSPPRHPGRARRHDRARQPHPALPPPPQTARTTTTSARTATASAPRSPTQPDARSPPTSHTHHPANRPRRLRRHPCPSGNTPGPRPNHEDERRPPHAKRSSGMRMRGLVR